MENSQAKESAEEEKRALNKMAHWCSLQERCSGDVRDKLAAMDLSSDAVERIIDRLKRERFLDDSRYALYYVKDKSRFNSWGPTKLRYMLRNKRVSDEFIDEALQSIDADTYTAQLEKLMKNKIRLSHAADLQKLKAQLLRLGASHGYPYDDTYRMIEKLLQGR